YSLLFERFLNPDRKSMPDIDTDFDDEGRQKVIDYVVQKYGKQQVAHIVTYGTMAAKMSIKDVARVLDLPLAEANSLAKLVPEKPGIKLQRVFHASISGDGSLADKENLGGDDLENVKKIREIYHDRTSFASQVLHEAEVLEGSVRGTGIHAAGIIIAPTDLSEIIPVYTAKDVDLVITQFEGNVIEDAGVIKMDFLGLKTLTILRDALLLIKQNHNIDIDIDAIPLDDKKTYELYQRGETNGTFQFESAGMQKYLRDLKPDCFDDLIAMNALYRPGPLEYIPNYIARKHGTEKVTYDLPEMEEYLKDTYGICVYQEQVMLLSQKLAGFSKGDADVLRKAMGKKQIAVLNKMKVQFMEGATSKGLDASKLEKVWTDWEAFASYAFNKSHSTCYAFVAFQTAYLKAHYPAEYMAAVLSNNQGNLEKITFFMEEARRMGIPVLGPDINESNVKFSVNKKGEIRYALSAIKGVGEAAVEELIRERQEKGLYKSLFDLTKRSNLRAINKRVLESLAKAGAF
ncbi:MAG TPA: DNA polymerase III subunit alpha, partial [Chitinophagales bacterium]|nr:DNA polymerase III subunit alpha [Chitinophagales bacterium]